MGKDLRFESEATRFSHKLDVYEDFKMPAKTYGVICTKGGVGKTTVTAFTISANPYSASARPLQGIVYIFDVRMGAIHCAHGRDKWLIFIRDWLIEGARNKGAINRALMGNILLRGF
jgi:hypothetical protein